jgi:hypothetical protein
LLFDMVSMSLMKQWFISTVQPVSRIHGLKADFQL